jgi:hydroxyacylglutathione hydrolase
MTNDTNHTEAKADPLEVLAIPAFRDNYIWLLRRGKVAVVVDPGDAAPVARVLAQEGLELSAILITHHHADHQGGVESLSANCQPSVFGPAAESITGLTHPLRGGEVFELPALDASVSVISVPGHTSGHLAYLIGNRLFCGDTIFGAGCGRLFEGTPEQMAVSLRTLAGLPDETEVYCAHEYTEMNLRFAVAVEPQNRMLQQRVLDAAATRAKGQSTVPSTMALEKATNPFLRCSEPAVVAAAVARGAVSTDPVTVFAAIRGWRNEF